MSKVAFRSKQLDFHKPVPIYWSEELAELSDPSVVTRAIPYIPSGMEKEEESEQHLQWALSTQEKLGTTADSVIPIPEVETLTKDEYEEFYTREFKITKHLIRIQTFGAETEFPDYDLDTEDEKWLAENGSRFDLTAMQFESMIDRLEKGCGNQVVQLAEARALLKEDDDLTTLVYNYWLAKRLRQHHPLLLHVKTDKRDGLSVNDPYVAFRRRAEKMQTRKNRKSDELSYERMVKLKRDCGKLVTLLELLRRREKSKKELIQLAREIFGKRYELNDFDGRVAMEAEAERMKDRRPAYMTPKFLHQQQARAESAGTFASGSAGEFRPQKRHLVAHNENSARANKRQRIRENGFIPASAIPDDMQLSHLRQISKAEHLMGSSAAHSSLGTSAADLNANVADQGPAQAAPKQLLPPVPDGRFAFKRMAGAIYLAPHPLRSRQPPLSSASDTSFTRLHLARHGRGRFCLTSIHTDASVPARPLPQSNASPNNLTPPSSAIFEQNYNSHPPQLQPSSACIGFARLRRGRGGKSRIIIDRGTLTPWTNSLTQISDWQSESPVAGRLAHLYRDYIKTHNINHYTQINNNNNFASATAPTSSSLFVPPPKLEVNDAVISSSSSISSSSAAPAPSSGLGGVVVVAVNGGGNLSSRPASSSHSPNIGTAASLRPSTPTLLSVATAALSTHNNVNGNSKLVFPSPMVTLLAASSASSSPNLPSSITATAAAVANVTTTKLPSALQQLHSLPIVTSDSS